MEGTTRILLVEDNPGDVRLVREALSTAPELRAEILHCERLSQALDRIDAAHIALLDLGLPDSQGLEGLGRMRALRPALPIIVLTGQSDEGLALEAVRAGAQDYLGKEDLHGQVLTRMIRYALERQQVLERLAQAEKLESIGQLAAGIAHEINTPAQFVGDNVRFLQQAFDDLSGALEHCQALVEPDRGVDASAFLVELQNALRAVDLPFLLAELPRALEQALEGLTRISRIVGAVRIFSHRGGSRRAAVDLNEALESTIVVARAEWGSIAELKLDLAPDLPRVPCFPGELNQALLNIVVNAGQAIAASGSERKGTIEVSTRHEGDRVWIEVRDDGPGMPERVRRRIFDPFFTTKEIGEGTGQGLFLARSVIVEKHGGSIEVSSEPGHGSCFSISLPLDSCL